MLKSLWLAFALLTATSAQDARARQNDVATDLVAPLKPFAFLLGDWEAVPGASGETGGSTFKADAQGHVLVRTNVAIYPASQGKPASRHDDLMVIAPERDAVRADYFDSEGHVIRYAAQSPRPGRVVFVSDVRSDEPRYRLSYTANADGTLTGDFEVAAPGAPEAFKPYLTWTARRR